MVDSWRSSTWGEEISLEYGKSLRDYDQNNGAYRVFGSNGPIGWTDNPLVPGPGVILGRKGAYRGVEFSQGPFFVIDTAYYVVPKTELDMRWLYYAIKHHKLGDIDDGSPIPSTTRSAVYVRNLEVPPLAEQKAIAAILGALDDKIELNRRMNATLESLARALFQSWFVDFDPVRAKIDGRAPVGVDPVTASLLPDHFDHGEYGMLPVGWRLTNIDEVCSINAWTLGKADTLETLEYIEISEVSRGDIWTIAAYQRGGEPSRARRRLRHGDTVLSTVRPDRGSYFLALNPPENRVASTGFAVVTPTKAPWSFIHAALTLPEVSDHLGQMADGGAYPAIRPEVVGGIRVALPDKPMILESFQRVCAPLYEQAEANRVQSRTLANLRDALLPQLLGGKLDVHLRHPRHD